MSAIDIAILLETDKLITKFIQIWNTLTDIYNRELHITKSNIAVNRDFEMKIQRLRVLIMPLRTELEKLIDDMKEKKEQIYQKIL